MLNPDMNQRIQELAIQAGFTYIRDEGIGWAGNHNASLPKFAELIVRECIDIVSLYAIRMENFDGGHPVTDLKKHFGVEV